jgi:drug/metabolite transporter (DMT)-like permease
MEPVFTLLFSFVLLGEVLSLRQLIGSSLILAGIVSVRLRQRRRDLLPASETH